MTKTCLLAGCHAPGEQPVVLSVPNADKKLTEVRGFACSKHYLLLTGASARPYAPRAKPTASPTPKSAKPGERMCEEPDCSRKHEARGMCALHYGRWVRARDAGREQ